MDGLEVPERDLAGREFATSQIASHWLYRKRRREGMRYVRIPLHVTEVDARNCRRRCTREQRREVLSESRMREIHKSRFDERDVKTESWLNQ